MSSRFMRAVKRWIPPSAVVDDDRVALSLRAMHDEPRCVERDAAEHRAQVVTDHPHEVVAGLDELVGARALDDESLVGGLALEAKERDERLLSRLTLDLQSFVRDGSLLREDLVLGGAFGRNLPLALLG